ncbi:hypothetical protein P9112_010750 [Eukaryota sp. TZLM1-RC]
MKLLVLLLLLTAVFARSVPFIIYHTTVVHGWLLPKRHNSTEYAYFGDLQSMIEHTNSTPTPTTLNPNPTTLNPNPTTPNPNPTTPNPNPTTPNPNPTTLTYYYYYSSLTGHLSQTLVGINNADVTFINVDVVHSQASRHVELTNCDFTATDVQLNNLEVKVFDIKSGSVFEGLCVQLLNIDTPSEAPLNTSFSKVTLVDSKILDSSVFRLIDFNSSAETTLTNLVHSSMLMTQPWISLDSDGKVIGGCANDEPLITLVKSNVDFDDVVVVGFQSQSIVTTDSTIDLETVLVRHSTANDGHFELTNSDLKLTNVEFKNLEGKVFGVKSDFKVEGSNVYYCVGNLGCLIMVISRGTNNHNQTQTPKYQVSLQYREQFSLFRVIVYRYINDCLIINHSVFDCLLLITVKKDLFICICIVYLLSILYYLCCFVFFNYYSDEVVVVDCQSQFFVATNFTIHFKTVVSSNNDQMIVTDASTIGSSTICELSSDWVPDLTTHGDVEANPGPSIDLFSIKSLEPMEFVVDEVINYFSAKWMIQSNHVSILNVNVVQSALLDDHESMVRTMRNYIITPILNNHNCHFVIIPINDVFGKTVSSMDIKSGGMGNHWIVLVIDVMGFLKK